MEYRDQEAEVDPHSIRLLIREHERPSPLQKINDQHGNEAHLALLVPLLLLLKYRLERRALFVLLLVRVPGVLCLIRVCVGLKVVRAGYFLDCVVVPRLPINVTAMVRALAIFKLFPSNHVRLYRILLCLLRMDVVAAQIVPTNVILTFIDSRYRFHLLIVLLGPAILRVAEKGRRPLFLRLEM